MFDIEIIRSGRHTLLICPAQCKGIGLPAPPLKWLHTATWQSQEINKHANSGRGKAILIAEPQPMVLRNYSRGGLVRHIAERRFIFNGLHTTRPYRELQLLQHMYQAGLPVPRGLAGRVSRYGVAYEASILMEQIPNSVEVHEVLLKRALSQKLWYRMGQIIRQMHSLQVYHHDLNIHNIMIDSHEKLWLIDFDKCSIKTGNHWKAKNVERLLRSLHKEQGRHVHYTFELENWDQLMTGYQSNVAMA